jgi:hypothetical protein
MTLMVRLPLLARSSTASQWAAIRRRVISKLDRAGVGYTVIQVETGGLVYLPKDARQGSREQ